MPIQNELNGISGALKAIQAKIPKQDDSGKRSANAAEGAARWAFWMVMVGLADTAVTLFGVWLIWNTLEEARRSAKEAGRQADAAEATLDQAKITTESDLRAWLDVEVSLDSFSGGDAYANVKIEVRLVNVGKTPALRVATSEKVRVEGSIVVNGGELPAVEKYPIAMPSLMPGKDAAERFGMKIEGEDIGQCIRDCQHRPTGPVGLMVTLDVIAYYHTIFDSPNAARRMTSVRYHIHPAQYAPRHEDRSRNWIRNVSQTGEVRFSRDKSAPVYMT